MIPDWNSLGVLPPIGPGKSGSDIDRSPYNVRFCQIVDRFAVSSERVAIIQGLLNYRKALYDVGIICGIQWLDGSFMEQIEIFESRPPNDIDVVTFFNRPDNVNQEILRDLFDPAKTKGKYRVDAYPCILEQQVSGRYVKQIAYWYSMWAHKRNGQWKGFVQVDLSPNDDSEAVRILNSVKQEGEA